MASSNINQTAGENFISFHYTFSLQLTFECDEALTIIVHKYDSLTYWALPEMTTLMLL